MAQRGLEQRVENLERRVETVEQILPTLATKADLADLKVELKADVADLKAATRADLDAALAPLATKAELQAAIAPLATKAEVKAEGEATRRHFDVVAEGLRSDIALLATAVGTLSSTLERSIAENRSEHATFIAALGNHEVRLAVLERPRQPDTASFPE